MRVYLGEKGVGSEYEQSTYIFPYKILQELIQILYLKIEEGETIGK